MTLRARLLGLSVSFALLSLPVSHASACPGCERSLTATLSEQLGKADAAILVQWVKGQAPAGRLVGSTTYAIVEVARGPKDEFRKSDQVTVPRFHAGKKGDLFLLLGTKNQQIEWDNVLEVSETTYQYIVQAPPPDAPTSKRLEYFLKFLEYPDELVSNDAYDEFANAPWEDIVKIREKMDRAKFHKWVSDPNASPIRLRLYGLLLGLCGNEDDARMLETIIKQPAAGFRPGIDNVMCGYLLLTGDKGLDQLDKTKITDKTAEFSETYAAMQALRFMGTYGGDRISKNRLRQSMRELLDRPEVADLAIIDLTRWEDWSVQDRLMKLYDKEDYSQPLVKRAICRYMLVAAKPDAKPDGLPAAAKKARANLDKLRQQDPMMVKEAERYYFVR